MLGDATIIVGQTGLGIGGVASIVGVAGTIILLLVQLRYSFKSLNSSITDIGDDVSALTRSVARIEGRLSGSGGQGRLNTSPQPDAGQRQTNIGQDTLSEPSTPAIEFDTRSGNRLPENSTEVFIEFVDDLRRDNEMIDDPEQEPGARLEFMPRGQGNIYLDADFDNVANHLLENGYHRGSIFSAYPGIVLKLPDVDKKEHATIATNIVYDHLRRRLSDYGDFQNTESGRRRDWCGN